MLADNTFIYVTLIPILRLTLKTARLAALPAVHTVDLTQACTIIKVSDAWLHKGWWKSRWSE